METAWPIFLSEQKGEEVGMLQFILTIILHNVTHEHVTCHTTNILPLPRSASV